MTKEKKSYPEIKMNNRSRERYPVPPDIYQFVKDKMWYLTLDELKKYLDVSKRIAKALRNGVQIKLPYDCLMIMRSNLGFYRRYCLRNRIKWEIEQSCNRKVYIELNQYLAKVIAEMPENLAKLARGGWTTRHLRELCPIPIWVDQILIFQLLTELKKWYIIVHERWPEFDQALFKETGLFDDKSGTEKKSGSSERSSTPNQGEKKMPRYSRKSPSSMNNFAKFLINTGIFQLPSRGAPPRVRGM